MVEPGSVSVPTLGSYAEALDLPMVHVGKVRELYAYERPDGTGDPALLMVATDRISAFDFVLDSLVPDKGAVLTQLSQWWFAQLGDLVPNHVLSTDVPEPVQGRAVVCERLEMVPIECVARGYLTGSAWTEYQRSQSVCGVPLPAGLLNGSRLPEPIFTPATKAELGEHDENIDFAGMVSRVGQDTAQDVRAATLAVYARAEEITRARGMILADTKIELGLRPDGTLVLADEVLTPDSSRYWDAASWEPGHRLEAFDKQFVRDWLLQDSGWDRTSGAAPPPLPPGVVSATRQRYVVAYARVTGSAFAAA